MNIGIDAISAVGRSGNSTYTRELARHLMRLDTENSYYLFSFLHDWGRKTPFSDLLGKKARETHPYISRTLLPFDRIDIVNDRLVRMHARMRGIDVFHFTNPLNFATGSYASVATVHDLATFHNTSWGKAQVQGVYANKMRRIAKEAKAIIAVSEHTKKDLIQTLNVPAEKITVIYEAAGDDFYPDIDADYVRSAFGVEKYILYAGQLQPRKNALNLVKAWGGIVARYPGYKLVLVGSARDAEYLEELKEAASGIEDAVVFAGSVNITQLRKLYSTARCFVYPSFFEGFGLPILEAMQCGTPVVASNTSSLPEVVGDAGLLIDPHSPQEIADALERLLTDGPLRDELHKKALLQAKKFSWERAARETLAVYRRVAPSA